MRKVILCLLLVITAFTSFSQNNSKWHLGIDLGGGGAFGTMNENWSVRQNLNSYTDYRYSSYSETLITDASFAKFGIGLEYNFSKKISLVSGFRFTQFGSNFTGSSSYGNYFFLRTGASNSTQTDYYRIKSINEENNYLGIPLEFKYTFFNLGKFGFYGKVGYEIGFLIQNNTDIEFQLKEMQLYEQEVLNKVSLYPNNYFSTANVAFGINFKTKKDWDFNFDIYSGAGFLTKNNSTLLDLKSSSGVQLSVMMPINFSKKNKNNE